MSYEGEMVLQPSFWALRDWALRQRTLGVCGDVSSALIGQRMKTRGQIPQEKGGGYHPRGKG